MKIKLFSDRAVCLLLALLGLAFGLVCGIHSRGDNASYYLMARSFLNDGDMELDGRDIVRWNRERMQNEPFGAYVVIKNGGKVFFAKPAVFPILLAFFLFLFGNAGPSVLNGLCFGLILVLFYLFFKEQGVNRKSAILIFSCFLFSTYIPVYMVWMHPEMFLFAMVCSCVWLVYRGRYLAAALLIGIAAGIKICFLSLAPLLLIPAFLEKGRKHPFKVLGAFILTFGAVSLLNLAYLGQFNAYGSAEAEYGYIPARRHPYVAVAQVVDSVVRVPAEFADAGFNSLSLFARNLFYFLFGRFTGIFWYAFPAIVMIVAYLLFRKKLFKREKVLGDSMLFSAVVLMIFLLIFKPLNYFGGRDFICNRYFFFLPAFLFMPVFRVLKKPFLLALAFLPGMFISAPLLNAEYSTEIRRYHRVPSFTRMALFELAQAESFMIPSLNIRNIRVYSPDKIKRQGAGISLGSGEEIILVRDNDPSPLFLNISGEGENIHLKPGIVLTSRITGQTRSFYYYKSLRTAILDSFD